MSELPTHRKPTGLVAQLRLSEGERVYFEVNRMVGMIRKIGLKMDTITIEFGNGTLVCVPAEQYSSLTSLKGRTPRPPRALPPPPM